MQIAFPNQANVLFLPLVKIADGQPVTSGAVNFYLMALTGTNANKWYRDSDDTWQAAEALCGTGTHKARGHWIISISEDAWVDEVLYLLYADESGQLAIAVDAPVWCNTLEQMQKSDRIINTATTPWQVDYKDKDSGNTILTQTLKNTDGEDITSKNNILGSLEKV